MEAPQKKNLRAGFTLVELLVYIVLASIVVMIAGRTYVDSVRFRIATMNKLQSYSGVNEISQILQEDLMRLGLKGAKTAGNPTSVADYVYWNLPDDRSSFHHGATGAYDTLIFLAAQFDNLGALSGKVKVHYWVDAARTLWRAETSYVSTALTTPVRQEAMRMLTDVDSFKIVPGVYQGDSLTTALRYMNTGTNLLQFSRVGTTTSPLVIANWAAGQTISGFEAGILGEVYLGTATTPASITMKPNITYGIEVDIAFNDVIYQNFRPTQDYMALTLRQNNSGTLSAIAGLADAPFYTGGDDDVHTRTFDFSRSGTGDIQVTPVLRFACTNSCNATSALVYIRELRIWEHTADKFDFSKTTFDDAVVSDRALKGRVRAMKATVTLNKKGEITTIRRTIPTPNNGV